MTCSRHYNFFSFTVDVLVSFEFHQVDVSNFTVVNYWNDDRTNLWTKFRFKFFKYVVEVSVFNVNFGNVNHCGTTIFVAQFISFLCAYFNAVFCTYSNKCCFAGFNTFVHTQFKVEQTRYVNKVNFHTIVFVRSDCT